MKNECNVAKDLMPLVIDGVASEESQQYVGDHVAECTDCAMIYGAMKVELPRINAEKERAEMEQAAKRVRKTRTLRGIIGAVLAIVIFIGGSFAWHEIEFRLTQVCETSMALDAYHVNLVQTRAGNVIVTVKLNDRDDLRTTIVQNLQWAGVKGNTKNVMEIETLTTIIPSYESGDGANIQKMLRTEFLGEVVDGVWYYPSYREDSAMDEVALVCGDERMVIYTKDDEIPYCSEEMEAYYAAYHEKQPAGLDYPAWRAELVKLLDAAPETQ